jgi:hypothetical protein
LPVASCRCQLPTPLLLLLAAGRWPEAEKAAEAGTKTRAPRAALLLATGYWRDRR